MSSQKKEKDQKNKKKKIGPFFLGLRRLLANRSARKLSVSAIQVIGIS